MGAVRPPKEIAMRSKFSCALVVLAACDGSSSTTTADHGYLLVSRSALDARARLDDALVGPMPVALQDKAHTLAIGDRKLAIDTDESVLTYAHATDAHDTFIVGGDVYADRLAIEAAEPVVARIADALGANAEASGDGRWILRGDDLWPRVAELEPTGVAELFPMLITENGRGVIATTATTPSVPSVSSVPSV